MTQPKPGLLDGAAAGAMLTAALLGILYPLESQMGAPFVPFTAFEWLARALPGGLITWGLETLLAILYALGLPLAQAGKPAEAIMAVGILLAAGTLAGMGLFAVLRGSARQASLTPGVVLGGMLGLALLLMANAVGRLSAGTGGLLNAGIVLALWMAWGAVLVWVYNRLVELPAAARSGAHAGE
jgi:hypothetical protein